MKSKDRKEDRTENPEGSQDQSGFSLYITFFLKKNAKRLPVAVIFCFIALLKWLKARKEVLLLF